MMNNEDSFLVRFTRINEYNGVQMRCLTLISRLFGMVEKGRKEKYRKGKMTKIKISKTKIIEM